MKLFAILYEHLPDVQTKEIKHRLGGKVWTDEQDAKDELRLIRMQNLPLKRMWIISFDDPRGQVK